MMNDETKLLLTRRHFFSAASGGIGVAALASLLAFEDTSKAAVAALTGGFHSGISIHHGDVPPEIT